MRKLLIYTVLLISGISVAQENYSIEMDYKTNQVTYYRLDKNNRIVDTLAKPRFKRNSTVQVKLKNINPFAVDVVADAREETLHQGGEGFNFGSLLGGINSFSGEKLKLNVEDLPTPLARGTRGTATVNKFKDLNNLSTQVAALKRTLHANLLNPNLNKDAILQNAKDLALLIEDARLSDPNQNFYLFLSNLEKVVITDKQEIVSEVNKMSDELERAADSAKVLSRGELMARNAEFSDLQSLLTTLTESTNQTTENLSDINSMYTLLESSTFEKTYDYVIESDKVNLELKFVQSQFSQQADADNSQAVLKTRNIKLFAKGGFKINTSVAVTMNNFGDKSRDYYINEDGEVGSDANDYFIPNLSTMINFYPVLGESFNIGGTFGLSIPLSDNVKGVNFLLGPSIFLGSKSRLSLSGGLAYGPVDRLINGIHEGDSTELRDVESFTKKVYELGYFFGISFSLFDIN